MSAGARTQEAAQSRRYALVRLGLNCDAACRFCNVPIEEASGASALGPRAARAAVARAAAAGRVELSGGEPTLRPDLEALVALARARGASRVELQTNAISLAAPDRARALAAAGLTDAFVGLHAHRAELHDFLVRRRGAFRACLAGIARLAEAGVRVTLNPVVTTVQARWLVEYVELAARLPASGVCLSVVQPHGRASRATALVPRHRVLGPLVARALARADALGLPVVNPYCGLPLCVGGWHRRLGRCVEHCEAVAGAPRDRGAKFHPPACAPCPYRASCGGTWRAYARIHPVEDLRPPRDEGGTP